LNFEILQWNVCWWSNFLDITPIVLKLWIFTNFNMVFLYGHLTMLYYTIFIQLQINYRDYDETELLSSTNLIVKVLSYNLLFYAVKNIMMFINDLKTFSIRHVVVNQLQNSKSIASYIFEIHLRAMRILTNWSWIDRKEKN
jgi:hypothetical protein